jgi:hypothetical protein
MRKTVIATLVGVDKFTSKAGKAFRRGYFLAETGTCNVEGSKAFSAFLQEDTEYTVGTDYEFVYHKGDYIEV